MSSCGGKPLERIRGVSVSEAHPVTVNGVEGAYVEFSLPKSEFRKTDKVMMEVYVPDLSNQLLWAITCEVPADRAAAFKPTCAQIAKGFVPLPVVR